jgi:hypothetical protein
MISKKSKNIILLICTPFLFYFSYKLEVLLDKDTAQEYFERRCKEDAGEFIYRTVENVEGLFQMRPRDPRDYFSRMRKGDIPEDPYGHTNAEAQEPAALFLSYPLSGIPKTTPYQYFETIKPPYTGEFYNRPFTALQYLEPPIFTGEKYWLYNMNGRDENGREIFVAKQTSELKSQYGYTWREVITEEDEKHGVRVGELIVKQLATDEVLGLKRGFFYKKQKKMDICPKGKSERMVLNFVRKILIPAEVTQ